MLFALPCARGLKAAWCGSIGGIRLWQKVLRDKFNVKNCMPYDGAIGVPSDAGRRKGIFVRSRGPAHCSTGNSCTAPPVCAVLSF